MAVDPRRDQIGSRGFEFTLDLNRYKAASEYSGKTGSTFGRAKRFDRHVSGGASAGQSAATSADAALRNCGRRVCAREQLTYASEKGFDVHNFRTDRPSDNLVASRRPRPFSPRHSRPIRATQRGKEKPRVNVTQSKSSVPRTLPLAAKTATSSVLGPGAYMLPEDGVGTPDIARGSPVFAGPPRFPRSGRADEATLREPSTNPNREPALDPARVHGGAFGSTTPRPCTLVRTAPE